MKRCLCLLYSCVLALGCRLFANDVVTFFGYGDDLPDGFSIDDASSDGSTETYVLPTVNLDLSDNENSGETRVFSFSKDTYFAHLSSYLAMNQNTNPSDASHSGTCSYVALIGLLSYYDAFMNDNVIPEQYDHGLTGATTYDAMVVQSPGVLRQSYSAAGFADFASYVNATLETDLESKLIKNAQNLLIDHSYSIPVSSVQTLLNTFYGGSSPLAVSILFDELNRPSTELGAMSLIRDSIAAGNPVVFGAVQSGESTSGHACIAFKNGETSNTVLRNLCDEGANQGTYELLSGEHSSFAYILSSSALTHTHSRNFVIDGHGFCGCGIHSHVIVAQAIGSTRHTLTCSECSYLNVENHCLAASGSTSRFKPCTKCHYLIDTWHSNFVLD